MGGGVRTYWAGGYRNRVGLLRVNEDSGHLDAPLTWWRLGFDGKALLEAFVGTVVGLIALFSSCDHVSLPHRQLPEVAPVSWTVIRTSRW